MLVEVPYLFIQAVIYVIITYPMIGYHWSGYKIFWSFYGMFCNLLYFNYMGMLIVSLTPNIQVASILASSFYSMLNLFCGFTIPKPVSSYILLKCIKMIFKTLIGKKKELSTFIIKNLSICLLSHDNILFFSFCQNYRHIVTEWPTWTLLSLSNVQIFSDH